jgi:hypothetical protein
MLQQILAMQEKQTPIEKPTKKDGRLKEKPTKKK